MSDLGTAIYAMQYPPLTTVAFPEFREIPVRALIAWLAPLARASERKELRCAAEAVAELASLEVRDRTDDPAPSELVVKAKALAGRAILPRWDG